MQTAAIQGIACSSGLGHSYMANRRHHWEMLGDLCLQLLSDGPGIRKLLFGSFSRS